MRRRIPLTLALLLVACGSPGIDAKREMAGSLCAPTLQARLYTYSSADAPLPQHFLSSPAGTVIFTDNSPADDPITNAGATLGRVLFYDVRLSANDRVACASCHRQAFGFGDTARFSRGVQGPRPGRRTLALANARFNAGGRFFWDQRAPTLEAQVLQPIQDTLELAMPLDSLERKVARTPFYPQLFAAAFGSPEVTREGIARALAQFVRSLVSSGSRFDAMFATGGRPDSSRLTSQERDGFRLFVTTGCINCHRTIAQIADRANNIGLDSIPADSGAGQGRFKPASLRNIAVRPPYMHDGRFQTLRQVIDFYDHGVQDDPFLDSRLRAPDGAPRRLHLTEGQSDALIAFLQALTDSAFLAAPRFSDPFQCNAGIDRSP